MGGMICCVEKRTPITAKQKNVVAEKIENVQQETPDGV